MSAYNELPVYLETYRLLVDFVQICSKMPRDFRYTLGEQTKNSMINIILDIYHANEAREKSCHIAKARDSMVEVQLMIRVLNDTHQIGARQFAMLIEHTNNVSKQLAGWAKSVSPQANVRNVR